MGVLLFCPDRNYLRVRLSTANDRIRHFFGDEAGDLKQINAMKKMLEHRLEMEKPGLKDVAALRHFAALMANEILITEPRPMLVEEPDVELAQLFDELVSRTQRRELPPEDTLLSRLRLQLDTPRIKAVLKRDLVVRVPVFGNELKVPYAYQNGRLNLIEAHEFNQQREQDIIRDVLTKAAQGNLIFKHPDPEAGERQLVVVASFGRAAVEHHKQVETVLRDHNVSFIPETELADLERQIAETAH